MDIFWLVIFSLSLLCLHGHSEAILHEEPDFECVDIYKQPAFRHPLLKNHKIQMKAMTRMMKRMGIDTKADKEKNQTGVFGTSRDLCPDGQVPIHKQKTQNQTYHMESKDFPGQYFAALETIEVHRVFRGASAVMSIHAPHVENNQYSRASIWVENGPADQRNSIQFGWAAHSRIYPDARPRLTVFWTADGYKRTGCYNTLCPGYVQVDKEYYVGMEVLPKDSNGGPDSLLKVSIVQNTYLDGRWMLMVQDKAIGYWPKEVFPHLSQGATFLRYGGNTFESPDHILPTMGNGLFPSDTAPYYMTSAFFTHCKLALENSRGLVFMKDINSAIMKVVVDDNCYRVNYFQDEISDLGQMFGYGGHCIPSS
ncbi:PREDICTED: uncharacterized protein LOC104806704 [Tarenaya hassleriana]|uniref:uncharacterized protein LOC104806704 n=1 Tax=Tarenaya hassleriana TaxID=28532 RepID=UPI00053C3DB2|nr:PREDICTED: uncharacterized protein LOC104806704 [Tarenaya hassleriana]